MIAGRVSRITAGAVQLAVEQWGNTARPTVVLVHGYPDNRTVWYPVVERLMDRYHVVAYDVRGAGESDRPRAVSAYRMDVLAQDLAAVIAHVSPGKPVHLVGHDWGSIQSWEAVTDPAFQDRLASFTSISGPCLDHVGLWMRQALRRGDAAQRAQVWEQLKHSWYIMAFQLPLLAPLAWQLGLARAWPGILARLEDSAESARGANVWQKRDGIDGIALYRANMTQRAISPRERQTSMPVQVLIPRADPFAGEVMVRGAMLQVPQAHITIIEGGHWVIRSQPDVVADHIRKHIGA